MAVTEKYDFETIAYSTSGWNGLLTTVIEKIELFMQTRVLVTLGETVVAGDALFLDTVTKRWLKAQANGVLQPARGLAIENGDAGDEIRMQRVGPLTLAQTFKIGFNVWLSPTIPGKLTIDDQSGAAYPQCMGYGYESDGAALDSTHTIFVNVEHQCEAGYGPAGTTTTSTSSSSSTSSSTTGP